MKEMVNMIKQVQDYDFFKRLIALPFVEKIILYGSRARQDNAERSDIDIAFSRLEKVLNGLGIALLKPRDADDLYLDATIQRFEFSIELFWKLLKLLLASKGVNVVYPKDVLRESFAGKLINDEQMWLAMLRDRNMTSHTYNEELAIIIYGNIKKYYPIMTTTVKQLKTIS